MSEEHVIVIGNGPAGNMAALTVKERAPDVRVTLISRDQGSCYRPHLLPHFIAGKIKEGALYASPLKDYGEKGVKLRTGQQVVDVNLKRREVVLDHKEVISFSGLIIAVGGKAKIPDPLYASKELMFTLKTLEDARVWIDALPKVESVLMIGGDLTSFALTKALLHLEKKVYFILNEDAFWPFRCDEALFAQAAERLTRNGVEVFTHGRLRSIARLSDHAYDAVIDDHKIEVGMIGAFFGLVPDVQFLARGALHIDRGILVDEFLNTGVEDVYATGDCAQIYHPEIRDYWVSIGHDNAVTLGRIAAMNLLGARIQAEVKAESILDVQGVKVNTSWWTEF